MSKDSPWRVVIALLIFVGLVFGIPGIHKAKMYHDDIGYIDPLDQEGPKGLDDEDDNIQPDPDYGSESNEEYLDRINREYQAKHKHHKTNTIDSSN